MMRNRGAVALNRLVGALTVLTIAGLGVFAYRFYKGDIDPGVQVTLRTDRAGLLLDPGARVSVRGVPVGTVRTVTSQDGVAVIGLDIDPRQAGEVPANVVASLRPTTLLGAKYVDLVVPADPAPVSIAQGDELRTAADAPEADMVFQNVMNLLSGAQPQKINNTLSAVSGALNGRGDQLGRTVEEFNTYLTGFLPVADQLGTDLRLANRVLPAYQRAAPDLVQAMDNFRTTSATLTTKRRELTAMLDGLTEAGGHTTALVLDAGAPLTGTVRELRPTTATLARYSPEFTCLLQGAANMSDLVKDAKYPGIWGSNALLPRARPYQYPQDLPEVRADTGPNCRGLPLMDPENPPPHYNFDVGGRPPYLNGVDAGGGR